MKPLFLYNTLSRKKEEFKSLVPQKVSFYHCGPTVYWTQHIGNLRGMACADFIVRSLRYAGYETTHVRNYTDVGHLTGDNLGDADLGEDRMEKSAAREGIAPLEIANKYIKQFDNDTKELNIIEPNVSPRATEHIGEMIEMVKTLLNKGFAYITDLAIYFDISKVSDYTKLSGQNLEENINGAGKGDVSDKDKKNSRDFALWFFRAEKHKNALQYWSSPFFSSPVKDGNGFPGWHIECSAMSRKYLGNTIDIHMGGVEHIPVHHTNEIAQSEAANGVKFVNYWLHNEHLLVDDGKMSKSIGNVYSLSEVKEKGFLPLALRYFFLGAQYRSKQNFTWGALKAAQNGLDHINNLVRFLGDCSGEVNKEFKNKFIEALIDDFNTPRALAVAQELLKSDLSNEAKLTTIIDFDRVLGLDLDKIKSGKELPKEIQTLIKTRIKVRAEKNWVESDRLRDEIEGMGYTVEDSKNEIRVFRK